MYNFQELINHVKSFANMPEFLDDLDLYSGRDIGERHFDDKEKTWHPLTTFTATAFKSDRYEIEAKYNRCEICNKLRNSTLVVFDNVSNECFVKYFVRHGEDQPRGTKKWDLPQYIPSQDHSKQLDLVKEMKEMFKKTGKAIAEKPAERNYSDIEIRLMINVQKIKAWLEKNEQHRQFGEGLQKYQELVDKLRAIQITEDDALNYKNPTVDQIFAGVLEPLQGGDF